MKLSVDCHTYTNPATAYINDKLFPHDDPHLMHNGRNLRKNMTPAEQRLWKHLRGKRLGGYRFRRQQPLGQYILDFICVDAKLVIEIDGGQHAEQTAYDENTDTILAKPGIHRYPLLEQRSPATN